jgi:hypothetical protein
MAKYFSLFPKGIYNYKVVTDLLVRTKIKETWLADPSIYYNYVYKDSDRPEHIAQKYYGDEDLHWIIMFTNNAFTPNFDFPMSSINFDVYINNKYRAEGESIDRSGIEYAQLTPDPIFRYQKVTKKTSQDGSSYIQYFVIDKKSYFELAENPIPIVIQMKGESIDYQEYRRYPEVSIYDREFEVNEEKRLIKILKKDYVEQAKTELLNLLR